MRHTQTSTTDSAGRWRFDNFPSGRVRLTVAAPGFMRSAQEFDYDSTRGSRVDVTLNIGGVSETIQVTPENSRAVGGRLSETAPPGTSANVTDLQRRVAGVLPIAINVPRTGNSYRFVRPLVIDEGTKLTFRYQTK
jgi:hypothetical protein